MSKLLSGRATFARLLIPDPPGGPFGETHLAALDAHAAGRQRIASADGVECGWAAGGHVLDTVFALDKQVLGDALLFNLRVDADRLPGDLLRAYYQQEVTALAASNASGLPSARQKKEAREAARDRLEQEAKDGRFRKRTCVPCLWDGASHEVLFGATSVTHADRFGSLFQQTFGHAPEVLTAGRLGERIANRAGKGLAGDDTLSAFVPGVTPADVAWIADDTSRDYLGNEFLLWLWFNSEGDADTVTLTDGSEATYMIARLLTLECPRGQTGTEVIRHEGPSRLPEAKRAIQAGKLPRKAGLTLVRHDQQYELTLQAETFALSGVRLPALDGEKLDANGVRHARLGQLRHLIETVDGLYGAFLAVRLGPKWADTLPRMQRWLSRGEGRVAA